MMDFRLFVPVWKLGPILNWAIKLFRGRRIQKLPKFCKNGHRKSKFEKNANEMKLLKTPADFKKCINLTFLYTFTNIL